MSDFRQLCRWRGVIVDTCMRISTAATGRSSPRTAVRRLVCHRSADDQDLLPAQLPGPNAVHTQRPLLSDRGSPACRIPRVQALPSGRFTRLSEWNTRGDVVASHALIADGEVDRIGVTGLAARLGYTPASSSAFCRPRSAPACLRWLARNVHRLPGY